jgi:peptide/nickel transport system permease protein
MAPDVVVASEVALADGEGARRGPCAFALQRLLHHRLFISGFVLFGIIVVAILTPVLAPVDPDKIDMNATFLPPSLDHLFGTDNFGRSLFSRVVWGARLSMLIGCATVGIYAVAGTVTGALAGYHSRIDNVVMRANDTLMAFPGVLLAIAVTAMLGPSLVDVIIALGTVYTPRTARIVRSSVIVLREMEYVQAAIALAPGTGTCSAATSCPTRSPPSSCS